MNGYYTDCYTIPTHILVFRDFHENSRVILPRTMNQGKFFF